MASALDAVPGIGPATAVVFAINDGFNHRASGHAQHISRHCTQLDVGIFKCLMDAVGDGGLLVRQLGALAGQLSQFTQRLRGYEAASQQAVLQKLR
mgnify:CR=1 FL=1